MRKQLPEALDLISRALKAGHAFSGAMRLVADEFDDPLGPEFAETMDEINFGISVAEALKNLARRVDFSEINYFVVGVILQRETGGKEERFKTDPLADITEKNSTGKRPGIQPTGHNAGDFSTDMAGFIADGHCTQQREKKTMSDTRQDTAHNQHFVTSMIN